MAGEDEQIKVEFAGFVGGWLAQFVGVTVMDDGLREQASVRLTNVVGPEELVSATCARYGDAAEVAGLRNTVQIAGVDVGMFLLHALGVVAKSNGMTCIEYADAVIDVTAAKILQARYGAGPPGTTPPGTASPRDGHWAVVMMRRPNGFQIPIRMLFEFIGEQWKTMRVKPIYSAHDPMLQPDPEAGLLCYGVDPRVSKRPYGVQLTFDAIEAAGDQWRELVWKAVREYHLGLAAPAQLLPDVRKVRDSLVEQLFGESTIPRGKAVVSVGDFVRMVLRDHCCEPTHRFSVWVDGEFLCMGDQSWSADGGATRTEPLRIHRAVIAAYPGDPRQLILAQFGKWFER